MLFDKAQVIEMVKNDLNTRKKKDKRGIDLAMVSALSEVGLRMKSVASVVTYDASVSANDREITLSGENKDLKYLWYIKIGSGDEQKILNYKRVHDFLKNYDNPNASAGTPTYYTQVTSSNGFPVIKVDVPFEAADTLKVYYFSNVTPETVYKLREIAPIVQMTLAYLYGVETEEGRKYHGNAKELIALAMGANDFHAEPSNKFVVSDHDKLMNAVAKNISRKRY